MLIVVSIEWKASGYEIKKAFEQSFSHFQAASYGSIYPALAKLTEDSPLGQIVPELSPRPGEYIVRKTQASAFFGTGFLPWLVQHGVDTLFVSRRQFKELRRRLGLNGEAADTK